MPRGHRLSSQDRELLVKSFVESNLTQRKFCDQFRVASTTLQTALKKVGAGPFSKHDFCPIVVADPLPIQRRFDTGPAIIVRSPKNFVIEIAAGAHPTFIAEIVRVLS